MFKQVASAFWKIVRLAQETDRNRQSIKDLEKLYSEIVAAMEKKFYDSQLANERLVNEVQRLTDELKHQREIAESERRVLKVELENYLLGKNSACRLSNKNNFSNHQRTKQIQKR